MLITRQGKIALRAGRAKARLCLQRYKSKSVAFCVSFKRFKATQFQQNNLPSGCTFGPEFLVHVCFIVVLNLAQH